MFDLGWVLRFVNVVACGLVVAVVLRLWWQFGGCGGCAVGLLWIYIYIYIYFFKVALVDVGLCWWWLSMLLRRGCWWCCGSGGCAVVVVVVDDDDDKEELIYYFNI